MKRKLLLSTSLELLLALFSSVLLISYSNQINITDSKQVQATKIMEAVSEIRFVTFENLLHHDERSFEQWQSRHDSLEILLKPAISYNPSEQVLLADIYQKSREVDVIFKRLTASYNETGTDSPGQKEFEDRLATQLVSKQQVQISKAIKLSNIAREEAESLRRRTNWLITALVVLMFLIMATNFFFVSRRVSQGLNDLQKGTQAVAGGNLNYRIRTRKKDEFGELAEAFNSMADKLKQVDKIKSDFVLLASHQLRTPATAVKGFIALLMDGYMGKVSTKQKTTLQSAFAENERQIRIINEILMVAQTEIGEMSLLKSHVDVVDLVNGVISEQALSLKARGQTVKLGLSQKLPKPYIDAVKIRIVIENLVSNASKYSPDKSDIFIDLSNTKSKLIIDVKDNGLGIAKEDFDKLFKKFSRLSNSETAKKEGSGLGLYLVKKIIELHGGKISVHSLVGRGTTFSIQLPIERH